MNNSKNILACEEHISIAIDEFINETETFPTMESAEQKKCDYCDKSANYVITKS